MTTSFKEKYGSYAIVVGASAGIGEALASQIASKGVNLVLVARRSEKLTVLATALEQQFDIKTLCVPLDLLQEDAVDMLAEAVAELDIGLLVVNAASVLAGSFLKNSYEQESNLVRLNTFVSARLVHRIGNRMKLQKRGGILLVSSLAGNAPTPYQASYAATKAYLSSFGQALAFELASDGVDVLVVAPGATDTEGLKSTANIDYSKMKGVQMMTADAVAKDAIANLGNKTYMIPGFRNRLSGFILGMLPRKVSLRMIGRMTASAIDPAVL